jgi:glycosyltransferase involved in cell wall biosynthesis
MSKLLQLNECLNFSTGKIAQQIGEQAIANGWESWIAYSSREPKLPSESNIVEVGARINSYLHYVKSKLFDREGLASRSATNILIEKIKEIKPDVIQLHNIHDHWLNYRILFEYLNSTDIKVVWTFHDSWAFTGHCFHFVTKDCQRWKIECHDCPLQREYPKTFLDRSRKNFELKKRLFTSNPNLTIVGCSNWMADLVHMSFLKDKRIEVIHNGIDLNVFKPSGSKPNDGTFRVLAVSNVWNKEKGYYDILKLREHLPADYEIIIVGLTADQLKELPKGIKGIQRTQNVQEMVELYSSSNVLINPTYADTFPTINIEALACGTPVITYNTGGSPEIIDEKTGIVVEQGNLEALTNAITSLSENPLDSKECRKRAETLFNKEERFKDYINLYEQLLKE